jgi:hypothetical protein
MHPTDLPFGRFVTLVKCKVDIQPPGRGLHYNRTKWCDENALGGWDFYPGTNTFVFYQSEDATAFKLRFGL